MPLFGLKLGVHETGLAAVAEGLWRERKFDFLELYVPIDASPADAGNWRWYDGTLVLHAPHSVGGFNFSRRDMEKGNRQALELLEALRERLAPDMAVFHPGVDGKIGETRRQIASLRREFPALHRIMLIENKPRVGLNGEHCLGASPEEIVDLLEAAECGFCLDVRHAFAYAAREGWPWLAVLEDLAGLRPRLWHAADGDAADPFDSHKHIGEGNVPWAGVATFWSRKTLVTIECGKEPAEKLADFLGDTEQLRKRTISADIVLRPAGPDDVKPIWELANESETRENAYNSNPIPFANHETWFAARLSDPLYRIYIGEDGRGVPVGYIRFDQSEDGAWEIGISVDKRFRGKGIGVRLTRLGAEAMFGHHDAKQLRAWVKTDNIASRRMFERAGFVLEKEGEMHCGFRSVMLTARIGDETCLVPGPSRRGGGGENEAQAGQECDDGPPRGRGFQARLER